MSESTTDKLRSIYTDLDNRREFAIDGAIDDLHDLIEGLGESSQKAVIRTRNGEVDDIWIESVDVHLERMDRDEWSLLLYRGKKRVNFSIDLGVEVVSLPGTLDGVRMLMVNVSLNEDEVGCEREEQGE